MKAHVLTRSPVGYSTTPTPLRDGPWSNDYELPHLSAGRKSPIKSPHLSKLRVLVVDDNVDFATTLEVLLTRLGHQVMCAHSGAEGVGVARMWRPDIALLDVGLPDMDGADVARDLAADKSLGVRLIAMSGYDQIAGIGDVGFYAHLSKPFEFEQLKRLLPFN